LRHSGAETHLSKILKKYTRSIERSLLKKAQSLAVAGYTRLKREETEVLILIYFKKCRVGLGKISFTATRQ
jgi:hypothetical protein